MRRPSFRSRQSVTIILIVANIAAFFVQNVLLSRPVVNEYLALSVSGLKHGYLWQLLSFQFLHSGIWHLIFNCLAIFWFGRSVEEAVGRKSFTMLYFASGIIGGLFQSIYMMLLHQDATAVVGASAGASGLIAAFAVLFPDTLILLMFVLPMPAKFLLLIEFVLSIAGMWPNSRFFDPGIAHAAHLGGMICGVLFVRYAVHWRFRWPQLNRARPQPLRRLVKVPTHKPAWGQNAQRADDDLPAEEFLSKEVDPILDKISAHGIQSLTERERRVLEKARAKMAKR
jgi:membrane associated rhomboid family serine protease